MSPSAPCLSKLKTLPAPDVLTVLSFPKEIRPRQGGKGANKGKKIQKRKEFLLRVKDRNQELSQNNVLMKDYFDDLNRTVSFEC